MKRFTGGIIAACIGVILVIILLWTLAGHSNKVNSTIASTSLPSETSLQPAIPSPDSSSEPIAAEVNGEVISLDEWRRTTALEQALNTLAGKPPSPAETVLDRLINEKIALQANSANPTPEAAGPIGAEAHLQALMQTWGVNESDLNTALTQAGITRQELLTEIGRLMVVENVLQTNGGEDRSQAWLKAQRESAHISIFANLNEPTAQNTSTTPTSGKSSTQNVVGNISTPAPSDESISTVQPNNSLTNIENLSSGPNEGQLAPDFSLPLNTGENITLSELRGRPVVLNFWATWCPVCRKELPDLQAAAQEWIPQGVTFVSVDLGEDADTVSAFAAENNLTVTLALDTNRAVAQSYQVLGIPTTLFIDADGIVRSRYIGPLTEEAFTEWLSPLLPETSLEEPPADTLSTSSNPTEISVLPNSPYDFTLDDQSGNPFTLSAALQGQIMVLVFYRGKT